MPGPVPVPVKKFTRDTILSQLYIQACNNNEVDLKFVESYLDICDKTNLGVYLLNRVLK